MKSRKAHVRAKDDGARALPLPASTIIPKAGEGTHGNLYAPTEEHRRMVTVMRSNAMGVEAIALVMGMNKDTLRRHFELELDYGFEHIRGQMGAALVAAGLGGSVSAMKFWLASRCPEWRAAIAQVDEPDKAAEEVVHFFLPSNHRDEPEEVVGPIIDGKVE